MVRGPSLPPHARWLRPLHLPPQLTGAGRLVARLILAGGGLVVAGMAVGIAAYVVSWRLLSGGLAGSDTLFHLQLVDWISGSFPSLHWWYRWDANGVPYREGYPLAVHWVTVALARSTGLDNIRAMQLVQFAINPLSALGVYAYCAWRLGRPLAGVLGALLYLLSPIAWTFLVDWGFYANEAGDVLFMPALIALDAFFTRWQQGDRGWLTRAGALGFMGLAALLSYVSPAIVGGPFLTAFAYVLAVRGGWMQAARWLLAVAAISVGSLALAAFWVVPANEWLAVVASRHPAPAYGADLFHPWSLQQVLQLRPVRVTVIEDRTSLSPAVWVPALAGAVAFIWDRTVRVLVALVVVGLLLMTSQTAFRLVFGLPLVYLANARTGQLLLQFLVPVLAGLGLAATLPALVEIALRRLQAPRPAIATVSMVVALVALPLSALDVSALTQQGPGSEAAFGLNQRDLWQRHQADECQTADFGVAPPCRSAALRAAFNVRELIDACRAGGHMRDDPPICAALENPVAPAWDPSKDALIAATADWCRGRSDAVCGARYLSPAEQLADLNLWRPWRLGCFLAGCGLAPDYASIFPSPPDRAVLDAHSGALLKAFHALTGGGQFYSYNFQLLGSPELLDYMKGTMLEQPGATPKSQLAQVSGADEVILAPSQAQQAVDYGSLGWRKVDEGGLAWAPTDPTGQAVEWPGGSTVLVIGGVPGTNSHPYNSVFIQATQGMLPYGQGWLVRGRSPFVDDYSEAELEGHRAILLLGYQYHDAGAAWSRLDGFVNRGGSLFAETGWQFTDPDWNAGKSPASLPAESLNWTKLDPAAPVLVSGRPEPGFGSFRYQDTGWGASATRNVRRGAEAMVSVAGQTVVARWTRGKGRVVWSGMNLIAHAGVSKSVPEDSFLAGLWSWLLPAAGDGQAQLAPQWIGDDQVEIPLAASTGPVSVLLKQTAGPGWSAQLATPGGTRSAAIEQSEMDFMLVRLDSVPAGSRLVFTYGPTWQVIASWIVSVATLAGLLGWLTWPRPFRALRSLLAERAAEVTRRWRDEDS